MHSNIAEKKRRLDGTAPPTLLTSRDELLQDDCGLIIQSRRDRNSGRGRDRGRSRNNIHGQGRGLGGELSGRGRGYYQNISKHLSANGRGNGRHNNERNRDDSRNQHQNQNSLRCLELNIQHMKRGNLSSEGAFNDTFEETSSSAMTLTNDSTSSEAPFPSIQSNSPSLDTSTNKMFSDSQSLATVDHNKQLHNEMNGNKIITILSWPNPNTHYIPLEEETRLIPFLIRWGKSERGMMKDQPPFRLEKVLGAIGEGLPANECFKIRGTSNDPRKRRNHQKSNNTTIDTNASKRSLLPTQRMNLVQALSLRRHHLKLLNPRLSMSGLRLGNDQDVRDAALIFEQCVETYLMNQGVEFWTEEEQRKMFEESRDAQMEAMGFDGFDTKRKLSFRRFKQPPTPDFMMKNDQCVVLSYTDSRIGNENTDDFESCSNFSRNSTTINWIEAKMFYGASSIPAATNNAVGCILPKARDYVARYGSGAIVFMYGCGEELAQQLARIGVVALDGRCLDIERVEEHQRRWCADTTGNILF